MKKRLGLAFVALVALAIGAAQQAPVLLFWWAQALSEAGPFCPEHRLVAPFVNAGPGQRWRGVAYRLVRPLPKLARRAGPR